MLFIRHNDDSFRSGRDDVAAPRRTILCRNLKLLFIFFIIAVFGRYLVVVNRSRDYLPMQRAMKITRFGTTAFVTSKQCCTVCTDVVVPVLGSLCC